MKPETKTKISKIKEPYKKQNEKEKKIHSWNIAMASEKSKKQILHNRKPMTKTSTYYNCLSEKEYAR